MIEDRYESIYTGITNNLTKRFLAHQKGKGAKALRGKSPLRIVYVLTELTHKKAAQLEYKIKQLPRAQKLKIILGEFNPLELI
ncbi:GIY-YIG nuclease family protein [Thorsellia anophelis]|nr:GIY-YIG nuclease family protein [Thorsellia anophelis]